MYKRQSYSLKNKSGINERLLDGKNLSFEEFRNEILGLSFFNEKKLIIVQNVFSNRYLREEIAKSVFETENIIIFHEEGKVLKKDILYKFLICLLYTSSLPLSFRLIKNIHKKLLSGVRGHYKNPGEIRKSQNWIGGSSLTDAFFIPPFHTDLPELLTDLERFWHNKNLNTPLLIRIGITHYQFETIHPFLDGNGRIGRLLIALQLIEMGILTKPTLYLSAFFEKNRSSYYDALDIVRKTSNFEQWIKFFLNGVICTAEDAINVFKSIIDLRQKYEQKILSLGARAENAQKLLLYMFSYPVVSIKMVESKLDISNNNASRLIKSLVDLNILKEKTGYSRNRFYALNDYLNLFN